MSTFLNWFGQHPWLGCFVIIVVASVVSLPFKIANRVIRHRNIAAKGWPPAHLDGDGDFQKKEED